MSIIKIDLSKIQADITIHEQHINFLEKSLDYSPTQAKRDYLKELVADKQALELFIKLSHRFVVPTDRQVIEVKQFQIYRDGGSIDAKDKNGNEYHIPVNFSGTLFKNIRKPYYGTYAGKEGINTKYIPDNIELKIVEEFSE